MSYSETKCEIFDADGKTKLNVYEWIPKDNIRAVFLGVHGGMAHGGDFVTPALYFLNKSVATYAPDFRWHGTYPKYNTGGKVLFHVDSIYSHPYPIDRNIDGKVYMQNTLGGIANHAIESDGC